MTVLAEPDVKGVLRGAPVRVPARVLGIVPAAVPRVEEAAHHAAEDVLVVADVVIPVLRHVLVVAAAAVVVRVAAARETALLAVEDARHALVHAIQVVAVAEDVPARAHPRVVTLAEALALINVLVALRLRLSNIFKEKEYEKNRNQNQTGSY